MVNKSVFIILALLLSVYLFGCGKKQKSLEEMQEPMSMEQLSTLNAENRSQPEGRIQEPQALPAQPSAAAVSPAEPAATPVAGKLEPLPPSGPFAPKATDIQLALKNAGYYTGNIDGKIGPKSKKAIAEFQKANGLKADGKVGPKTWAMLSKHLNSSPAPIVSAAE